MIRHNEIVNGICTHGVRSEDKFNYRKWRSFKHGKSLNFAWGWSGKQIKVFPKEWCTHFYLRFNRLQLVCFFEMYAELLFVYQKLIRKKLKFFDTLFCMKIWVEKSWNYKLWRIFVDFFLNVIFFSSNHHLIFL